MTGVPAREAVTEYGTGSKDVDKFRGKIFLRPHSVQRPSSNLASLGAETDEGRWTECDWF